MNKQDTIFLSNGAESFSEYGRAFLEFLSIENSQRNMELDIEKIQQCCLYIEEKFKDKKRFSGEPYHTHLYEVAKNYIELKHKNINTNGILIALLHDNIEDLEEETFEKIQSNFGSEVALGISILTKPKAEDGDKEKRDQDYFGNFYSLENLTAFIQKAAQEKNVKRFSSKAHGGKKNAYKKLARTLGSIKICDRIHNLRTMPEDLYPNKKRRRKINQTIEFLSHLTQDIENPYLLSALQKAIFYGIMTQQRINVRNITVSQTRP